MGGLITDLKTGLAFCTRLPVAAPGGRRLADAAWTLPLAGVVVGAVGALVYTLADGLKLPPFVSATLAVGATVAITGCLHEDGLADMADGFGGGQTKARTLEIMRDSRIGTYGVIALILSFLLRVGAIANLATPSLVAVSLIGAHAAARGALPVFMRGVPRARQDGLSVGAGLPGPGAATGAAAIGLLISVFCLGLGTGLWAALLVAAALIVLGLWSLKKIGGQTGDVLGGAEQTAEIMVLLVAASLW